jgi:predicted RNase H-like HicB family nuclease
MPAAVSDTCELWVKYSLKDGVFTPLANQQSALEVFMELQYNYWKDGDFYLGYLREYPQYPTQGESIEDLETGLKEIYAWIKDGTLKTNETHGILKIAS